MASTPTTSPTEAVPGDELGGRYRLLRAIGQGGSATVFEATDLTLERNVAVKVLHRSLSADQSFLDRFAKEAKSAAALSHPNVMAIHDWGEDNRGDTTMPFLVMELLNGGSMRSMLDDEAVLSPSQAIQVGLDACRGLNYAHGQGLVHRDVTPANLIFSDDGRLHIADFGLAKALADSGWTEPGKDLVGTARYSSPEQAQGLRLTPASDVYSLGLVLVEALSGSVPFSADTMLGTLTARVESDVPIPDVPAKLADVLRAMTQRDPEDRPSSNQAGIALVQAADGMPRPSALPLVQMPAATVDDSIEVDTDTEVDADADVVDVENDEELAVDAEADIDVVAEPDPLDVTMLEQPDVTEVAGTPVVDPQADEPVRRWPWLLVTVAAIAALGWFGYGQLENAAVVAPPVPDVVGLSRDDAVAELGDTWTLEEKFLRDSDVAVGNVVMTDPEANELLEEGETLDYWVSLGRPLVRVPEADLIGRSREQAEQTLDSIGLAVGNVELVNSEDVGEGLVMDVVATSAELQVGESVDLVVSLGPTDRQIPDFTLDTDVDEYLANLDVAGLGVNRLDEFSNDVPIDGALISVDPPPGSTVERGDSVTVVVSMGPVPVPVPAASGRSLTDVLDDLDALGLLAGDLVSSGDGEPNAGCPVVGTDPTQGTDIQPGNVVTIILPSSC